MGRSESDPHQKNPNFREKVGEVLETGGVIGGLVFLLRTDVLASAFSFGVAYLGHLLEHQKASGSTG